MDTVAGPLFEALRIENSEKRKFAIDFIVNLIESDDSIADFFWGEFKQLDTFSASFIWANVPELFEN